MQKKASFSFLVILPTCLALISCSSTQSPPPSGKFLPPTIIERMEPHEKTPTWATGEKTMLEDGADIVYIKTKILEGDTRPDACNRIAEEEGRAEMLRYIKDNITASGQVSETNSKDDPGFESLMAFLSSGKISGTKISSRYWDKQEVSDSTGNRVLKIRCSSKISINKSTLEKQLQQALGAKSGNPEIRKTLLDAQKKFLENVDKSPSENGN